MDSTSGSERNKWVPVILLLVSMVSLQSGAAFAKQLLLSLGVAGTVTLRLCLASIMLCAVCRPWRDRLRLRSILVIALYGITIGTMNVLIYSALQYIPLGIAVALEFLGPLAVAVLGSRKKLDFLWVGMAATGVLILLPKSDPASALPWQGIAYALGAAICWALYIILGKKAAALAPSGAVASIGMLAGALAIAPVGAVAAGPALFDLQFLPYGLLIALMSSALPYYLEMIALKAMPARTFGVLMSLEPAVASLSGMIILHEYLSGTQWLAVACVMLASFGAVAISSPPQAIPEELGV